MHLSGVKFLERSITGKTKVLAIIGWPVEHSLSPLMQNAALEAAGLDFVFVPFAVMPEHLADAVAGLRNLNTAGFNVTIPHKTSIIPLLDEISPEAALIGAVNTVKRKGRRLIGYNTDSTGFLISLKRDLDFDPRGAHVLVIGAGGAARAAVAALGAAGAASVTIANRNPERSNLLVQRIRPHYPGVVFHSVPLDVLSFPQAVGPIDLLVNTTSVGMKGTSFPALNLSRLGNNPCIYDMVYTPAKTALLEQAAEQGFKCANGLGMLIAQGEEAFKIWTGVTPPPGIMAGRIMPTIQADEG